MASTINSSNTGFGGIVQTGDSSGQMQLQTAGTTAVTIDTSQNVGIGTTTISTGYISGNGSLTLQNAKSIAFNNASNTWSTTTTGGAITYFTDNNLYIDAKDSASNMIFRVNGATERMRIDSSGKVGIGMTPTAVLSIQTVGQNFGGGLNLKVSGGTSNFEFVNGGDNKLYLGYAGSGTPAAVGNFATNGTYTATSDIRKKKDISYTFNGLEIVNALKPAQGRMLEDDDTSPLRPMFIAQDMVDVIPALVSNLEPAPSDSPLLGIDYASIAPILVKAIQEQQTIINDLKSRIETLENK
jgi:hypothetical protein